MSENISTTDAVVDTTDAVETKPAPEKGTWQATLHKSAVLFDRSGKARKQASNLLWEGAKAGIESWLPEADNDVSAEGLYTEIMDLLGKPRKGDASKIKTVALAAKNNGLVLSIYPNLSKAYAEATRLTKTVQVHAAEDEAAEKAIEDLAAHAPKSSSTPEGAAQIVLAQGVDEAARLLLDALGKDNAAAHRAFMRAVSQETAGRVKPATPKVTAGPKAGAKQVVPNEKVDRVPLGDGASKAKPKAAPKADGKKAKAAPVKAKAKPVQPTLDAPVGETPAESAERDAAQAEAINAAENVTQIKAKAKPVVVRR